MAADTSTGNILTFDLIIGAVQEHARLTRQPQPIRRDFADSIYTGTTPSNPLLLPVKNQRVASGRLWEVTDIGAFGPDGHTVIYGPLATQPAVPASTVNVQNTTGFPVQVTVTGGTVTAITVNGQVVASGDATVLVPAGGVINITYSVAPTWTWNGQTIAETYLGPNAGQESPGDFASFIEMIPVPGAALIGDHKAFGNAQDVIYAWIYNPPANTTISVAGTVLDWRQQDREEMVI